MNLHLLFVALAIAVSSVFAFRIKQEELIVPPNFARKGKDFSFFSSWGDCTNLVSCSNAAATNFGACMPSSTCKSKGGTTISGSGCSSRSVCCQIFLTCNSTASSEPCIVWNSGTIVKHEIGMTNYRRRYRYRKPKGVCQLRLDFDEFLLANPADNGYCNTDLIYVGGLSLCGSNRGQHAYFTFGRSNSIDLTVRIEAADTARFSIRNTYIPCNSDKRAPDNCLQYFEEAAGRVTSFNFQTNRVDNMQTNNFDYSVCIKQADGMNQIMWRTCTNTASDAFFISGGGPDITMLVSPDCTRDWVQVYGRDRYCGRGFPTVISTVKPFLLNVHFDEAEGFGVTLPTNVEDCNGITIEDPYSGGSFFCDRDPPDTGECTCTYEPNPTIPPEDLFKVFDSFNTGFCIDYVQLP